MEKSNYIVAIDLGCSKVVAAAGRKNSEGKLEVLDVVEKPMEGMVRGEVTNIEQVTKAMKEAVGEVEKRLGSTITEAYMSISGQHIQCAANSYFVYVGSDGEIKTDDVDKLCENMSNVQPPEGAVILDRIPQDYIIDGNEHTTSPVGMFGRQLEATFNFVLAGKAGIERHKKAFDRVDIKCRKLIAGPLASGIAVASDDEKELGVAVVDLGAGTTDICIWHNNAMRYVAVVPMGADAINKDIRSTAIPDRFIEKLKVGHGYAAASSIPAEKQNLVIKIPGRIPRENKEISYRDLSTIIEARMLDIIEYVKAEIKDSGYADKLGSGIILTGGGSLLAGVDVLFKERTGYDVRLASAESNIGEASREALAYPGLTTVAGLMLIGSECSDFISQSGTRPMKWDKPSGETAKQEDEHEEKVAPKADKHEQYEKIDKQETPDNDDEDDFDDDDDKSQKKKSKIINKITNMFNNMFGVIDDDDETL